MFRKSNDLKIFKDIFFTPVKIMDCESITNFGELATNEIKLCTILNIIILPGGSLYRFSEFLEKI